MALRLFNEVLERDSKLRFLERQSGLNQARMQKVLGRLQDLEYSSLNQDNVGSFTPRTPLGGANSTRLGEVSLMLIEDDDFQRMALQNLCQTIGYKSVHAFSSATEALAYLTNPSTLKPSLILLDIELANDTGDGFSFLGKMRAAVKHSAAIVMVSMYHSSETMERCLIHDADSFMSKPLSKANLESLTVFVGRRRRMAQAAVARTANLRQTIEAMEGELKSALETVSPGSSKVSSQCSSLHASPKVWHTLGDIDLSPEATAVSGLGQAIAAPGWAQRAQPTKHGDETAPTRVGSLKHGDASQSSKSPSLVPKAPLAQAKSVKFKASDEGIKCKLNNAVEILLPLLAAQMDASTSSSAGASSTMTSSDNPAAGSLRSMLLRCNSSEGASTPVTDGQPRVGRPRNRRSSRDDEDDQGPAATDQQVLCRICERHVTDRELLSHLNLCAAGFALRQSEEELNAELELLMARLEKAERDRFKSHLIKALSDAMVSAEPLHRIQELAISAYEENASSRTPVLNHIQNLSTLAQRVGRVREGHAVVDDAETDFFATELQAIIGEKVAASREIVAVCPTALDAPLPRTLVGVPSLRDFELLRRIAKGGFGTVWTARKKSSGDVFALKALKKEGQRKMKQVEEIILKQHRCEYLVRSFFSFASETHIFFALEWCPGGDLDTMLAQVGMVPESSVRFYFSEVLCGLSYLHSEGIIHHDIKPSNMLITASGHLKLADFGLSAALSHSTTARGTQPYLAPEVLRRRHSLEVAAADGQLPTAVHLPQPVERRPSKEDVAFAVDLWSFGIVLHELLIGERPFRVRIGDTPAETLATIESGMVRTNGSQSSGNWMPSASAEDLFVSQAALNLCTALLRMDPATRLSCEQIRRHPFFEQTNWERLAQEEPPFIPELSCPEDARYFETTPGYSETKTTLSTDEQDLAERGPASQTSSDRLSQDHSSVKGKRLTRNVSFQGGVHKHHLIQLSLQSSARSLCTDGSNTDSDSDDLARTQAAVADIAALGEQSALS